MAALRDLPAVIRQTGLIRFLKKIWHEINDDNLFTWASALAYSWLFAVFPFFLVLLSLLPLLKQEWKAEARHQINYAIAQLPHDASVTVHDYVEPKINQLLYTPPKGIWSIGLLLS